MKESPPVDGGQEAVPLFRSWKRAYLVVLILLAVLIVCFASMSRIFS